MTDRPSFLQPYLFEGVMIGDWWREKRKQDKTLHRKFKYWLAKHKDYGTKCPVTSLKSRYLLDYTNEFLNGITSYETNQT